MKRNLKRELEAKTIEELKTELTKRKTILFELKFKLAQGQLKDVRLPGKTRNEIAVLKTIISKKEAEAPKKVEKS
ncbi:MAG: 50S ribosomal protein L29 [Patescibacteria group bacterium]|nr:50S ribosomal protein L29 [Patescibacteria group bacterium]